MYGKHYVSNEEKNNKQLLNNILKVHSLFVFSSDYTTKKHIAFKVYC